MTNLSDSDQLRNLIAAYAHASDVEDAKAYAELFAPGGCLVEYDVEVPAHRLAEFVEYFIASNALLPQPRGCRHMQGNTVIHHLDETTASATTDVLVADLDAVQGWHLGGSAQYLDQFVKLDGRWYFSRREVSWYKGLGRDPLHPDPVRAEAFRAFVAGGLNESKVSG